MTFMAQSLSSEGPQLVKEFPVLSGTLRFTAIFTTALQFFPSIGR
jgi:hypothetical protein